MYSCEGIFLSPHHPLLEYGAVAETKTENIASLRTRFRRAFKTSLVVQQNGLTKFVSLPRLCSATTSKLLGCVGDGHSNLSWARVLVKDNPG